MEKLDEEIATTIKADRTVEQKLCIMEDTLQAEEMEEAQAAFLVAVKKFRALDSDSEAVTNLLKNVRWWNALEALHNAGRALWELFTGGDRSVESNQMYNVQRVSRATDKGQTPLPCRRVKPNFWEKTLCAKSENQLRSSTLSC